jgi:16S rRNA (cytosine967-C5)-methyltransferase
VNERARRSEPGAATRGLAARAVEAVLATGTTLEAALGKLPLDSLAGSDRSQVKALAYGALRWHDRHRHLLGLLLERGLPANDRLLEALLSVGCFQVLDEAQPDYAAVSASVAAARWLGRPRVAGLVNAALRRLQREREQLLAQACVSEEACYSHPAWLIERLRRDWPAQWQEIVAAAQRPPPLWLRMNAMRGDPAACRARLAAAGLPGEPIDGVPEALRLARPVAVSEIPGFAAGDVTVQDAASQLAAQLLDPVPGARVLDACAAPGGKTTHLLERAGGRLELTALDIDAARLARLRENLARLGLAAAVVAGDAEQPANWWDGQPYDCILVDAPCSGTGVIRRHPDIKLLRRDSDIAALARRQLGILRALWPLLRPGGLLLYATCSIFAEENVAVVGRFLAEQPDAAPTAPRRGVVPAWALPQPTAGWQVLPGRCDTDGLYYALMTRSRARPTQP